MASIKRSKISASAIKKKTVIPEVVFETEARALNRKAMKLINRKSPCFRYFVAFTISMESRTIFKNEIVEMDKVIESMDDIQNIEERITADLNNSIKNGDIPDLTEEIDGIQIINFKRIG